MRYPRRAGFTGLAKGEAVEHLQDERLRTLTVQEMPMSNTIVVIGMDLGRVEYSGSAVAPVDVLGHLS